MITTYNVTSDCASKINTIKNAWLIVNCMTVVDAFVSRAAARAAKATGLCGKVVSLKEVKLQAVSEAPLAEVVEVEEIEVEEIEVEEIEVEEIEKSIKRHSTVNKPCRLVWELADSMPGARRKDVIAAAEAKGVAFYTARTQYQLWAQVQKEMAAREAAAKK